jgi:glycine betaine/proline transport system permease protein
LGASSLKDLTRASSKLIEWPTTVIQIFLVSGITQGFGAQQVVLVPPLSWLGIAAATVLLGWRLGRTAAGAVQPVHGGIPAGVRAVAKRDADVLDADHRGSDRRGDRAVAGYPSVATAPDPVAALIGFDQLQTIPVFAYLVPIIIFFGLGYPPPSSQQ